MADLDDNPALDEQPGEDDLLGQLQLWYQEATEEAADWKETAQKCIDFKAGRQWNDEELEALKSQQRPALVINHILPTINFLAGVQRQNKKDIKFRPLRKATLSIAEALSALVKHTLGISNGEYECANQFEDGIITGSGWIWAFKDYDNKPDGGEIKIRHVNPFRVLVDPACDTYDINDSASYVFYEHWEDRQKYRLLYPDKADQFAEGGGWFGWVKDNLLQPVSRIMKSLYGEASEDSQGWRLRRQVLVRECFYKVPQKVAISTDSQDGTEITAIDEAAIARAKEIAAVMPGRFGYREAIQPVLHKAIVVGDVLVEHVIDPQNGCHKFPLVRFAPYFDHGKIYGVVENLIGPQREENKRRSQVIHLLNQTANSGWKVKKLSPGYEETLRQFGATPGVIIDEDKCGGQAEKIQPNQLSQGHMLLASSAANDIKEISGVNNLMVAENGNQESGYALSIRQRQGMLHAEVLFDRHDHTMRILGDVLKELVRLTDRNGNPVYTAAEIRQVIGEEGIYAEQYIKRAAEEIGPAPQQPMPPDPAAMQVVNPQIAAAAQQGFGIQQAQYQQQAAMYEQAVKTRAEQLFLDDLRRLDTGSYSVAVDESPVAPTARAESFMELMELVKAFPGAIPPEAVIEASDIANRDQIVEAIKQQRQAMQQAQGAMIQ